MLFNVTTVGGGLGDYVYKLLVWGLGDWRVGIEVKVAGGGFGLRGKEALGLIGAGSNEIVISVYFEGRVYRRNFIFKLNTGIVEIGVKIVGVVYKMLERVKGVIKVFRKG